jgi:hypothetical protein
VRSRSTALLLAFAVAACTHAGAPETSGYAPKWHVGDWWVTKTWEYYPGQPPFWTWHYRRYDVLRMEKVGGRSCFLLITRTADRYGNGGNDTVFSFVRADSWLVVMEEYSLGKARAHSVENAPHGRPGLYGTGSQRIPMFPLRLDDPDTSFKLLKLDRGGSAELRELSSIADASLVRRLLDDGDTMSVAGFFPEVKGDSKRVRVLRPTGAIYQVRKELGGEIGTDNSRISQSLQFWSNGQPWRVYEERVQLEGLKPVRRVVSRAWLIAVGHGKQ